MTERAARRRNAKGFADLNFWLPPLCALCRHREWRYVTTVYSTGHAASWSSRDSRQPATSAGRCTTTRATPSGGCCSASSGLSLHPNLTSSGCGQGMHEGRRGQRPAARGATPSSSAPRRRTSVELWNAGKHTSTELAELFLGRPFHRLPRSPSCGEPVIARAHPARPACHLGHRPQQLRNHQIRSVAELTPSRPEPGQRCLGTTSRQQQAAA